MIVIDGVKFIAVVDSELSCEKCAIRQKCTASGPYGADICKALFHHMLHPVHFEEKK